MVLNSSLYVINGYIARWAIEVNWFFSLSRQREKAAHCGSKRAAIACMRLAGAFVPANMAIEHLMRFDLLFFGN